MPLPRPLLNVLLAVTLAAPPVQSGLDWRLLAGRLAGCLAGWLIAGWLAGRP